MTKTKEHKAKWVGGAPELGIECSCGIKPKRPAELREHLLKHDPRSFEVWLAELRAFERDGE